MEQFVKENIFKEIRQARFEASKLVLAKVCRDTPSHTMSKLERLEKRYDVMLGLSPGLVMTMLRVSINDAIEFFKYVFGEEQYDEDLSRIRTTFIRYN